ncbi:MAG: response regulator [Gemmatimonadaceae bacterium]|nr:response regulator [Acetobacteraceae bacterium]
MVEDEPLVREMIAESLAEEGFVVTEAGCGDEAAGLIDDMEFDLLLTDVHMPGRMDGLDVAAHARRVAPDLPIVVVTGRPEVKRGVSQLQPRCALVLKPYRMSAILQAIDGVCV